MCSKRSVSQVVVSMLITGVVIAVAGLPAYVFPRSDDLRPVDAIVVLGGPEDGREEHAESLAREGWAPTLVYSNPYGSRARGMTNKCSSDPGYKILCFTPKPATTQGEARSIASLAVANGWSSLIVVTYRPHISRARYIVGRCYSGQFFMAGNAAHQSLWQWANSYVYQTAGFVRALVQDDC